MSLPLEDDPDNTDHGDNEAEIEPLVHTHSNLDQKKIHELENQILQTMQPGASPGDPLYIGANIAGALPDGSVAPSASSSSTSPALYSPNSGMSMEAFSLDTLVHCTASGAAEAALLQQQQNQKLATVKLSQKKCCSFGEKQQQNEQLSIASCEPGKIPPEIIDTSEPLPPLLPPPLQEDKNKICLVLDLDETLVHSSFLAIPKADFTFYLGNEDNQVGVFVLIRPGAEKFLTELGSLFELVVFTASCQPYADMVIDYIDPSRVIKYRLYRDSCTDFGGNFVKDLSRLNRKLERIIIIDNSPSAYLLQPYNAIAISSWFDEPNDNELILIQEFLKNSYRIRNIYDLFSPE